MALSLLGVVGVVLSTSPGVFLHQNYQCLCWRGRKPAVCFGGCVHTCVFDSSPPSQRAEVAQRAASYAPVEVFLASLSGRVESETPSFYATSPPAPPVPDRRQHRRLQSRSTVGESFDVRIYLIAVS